ncbi:MAG: hypothetical protein WC841_03105 [Candidatus Shapirobacteria bacterium]|jgi:purine-nucleoside phosphorylase
MYKSFTKSDFEKILGLPNDYHVNGVLSCGHYDFEKQIARLEKSLTDIKISYQIVRQTGYLQNTPEVRIGEKIYWFTVVYGGVTLSEYLHFACTFGSKKNIHIGSCGGLYPEMNSVDYLIPTFSFGNESSTRFYDRDDTDNIHYPNNELNQKIKSKLKGEKIWEGPMMTCGAMLAETKEDVEKWSKEGYFGVEMETSTVFAVSNHFKVPSASLVYVTDNLIKGQVVGDESHTQQKEFRYQKAQKMFDVAVSVLLE